MAIRLIRKKSETPNVLNTDDARMVRYAYGGYDGVVKNRGAECGYEVAGTTFKITSGVLVLQGWEVEIDSNGWSLTIDSLTKYYAVYLEVNLATDTAEIKSTYDTAGIPSVSKGDDLTQTTNGTARMVLYTFKTTGNSILNVVKKMSILDYQKSVSEDLYQSIESIKTGGIVVGNSKQINSLELKKDSSGLLKIGDIIIPQKKLLSSSLINFGGSIKTLYSGSDILGKTYEMEFCNRSSKDVFTRVKFYAEKESTVYFCIRAVTVKLSQIIRIYIYQNRIDATSNYMDDSGGIGLSGSMYVRNIYEVVE